MLGWLNKIALWLLIAAGAWAGGLYWFAGQIPNAPADDIHADLIVVLTGGAGRLEYGLSLLADGKGKALFISGVDKGVSQRDILRQAAPDVRARLERQGRDAIFIGDRAVNTIGNAEETKRWLAKHPYHTLALVTSHYHMPRSLSEFRELLSEEEIIPAPVFADAPPGSAWWSEPQSRNLILSEYHKYLASQLRHWLVSAMHSQ